MKPLLILLVFLTAASCETIVEFDVEHEDSRLVLNSFFNNDSTMSVDVHESIFVLEPDKTPRPVPDAEVLLYDGEGNYILQLINEHDGTYTSNFIPEAGETYHIEASKNGFETISAENAIPEDSVVVTNYSLTHIPEENQPYLHEVEFTIKDEPSKDFYEVALSIEWTLEADSLYINNFSFQYLNSNDAVFSEYKLDSRHLYFNDALFDGNERTIKVFSNVSYPYCTGDCTVELKAYLHLRKISEAYYKYKESFALQNSVEGDPFAEPVPVFNNIENGYGIFAGYQTSLFPLDIEVQTGLY